MHAPQPDMARRDIPDALPLWFRPIPTMADHMLQDGAAQHSLDAALRRELQNMNDDRCYREMSSYINDILDFIWGRPSGTQVNDRGRQPVDPARMSNWAIEAVDRVRYEWFNRVCPTALWNRRLEDELREMGVESRCPEEHYRQERREFVESRLSRSRTPQRRFPRNRVEDDRNEGETDETGFMEHRWEHSRGNRRGDSRDYDNDAGRHDRRGRSRRTDRDLSGVNPRWLDNRTRSPGEGHTSRGPDGSGMTSCVTREVRHLRPASRTNSVRHGGATGSTEPPRADPGATGRRSGPPSHAGGETTVRMEEAHGVDAWRFLIGVDAENFEAGVDVVAAGRPVLPEFASAMITEDRGQL